MPGDPERVKGLARRLHDFADDVGDALRQIKGMAEDDALLRWAGKSADAFTAEFEDVPKNLRKLKKSYDLAGDALAAYWPELEKAQDDSRRALEKGREARRDLSTANTRLESANDWVDRAGKKAKEYEDAGKKKDIPPPDEKEVRAATRNATHAKDAQQSAQTAVDNAQSALDAAKKMAADAKKLRETAAEKAKKKLEEASDAGIQNRSWWEEAVDWVSDNWDTIVAVCKVVVAIVGIIAMIIGGPILGAIVLIAALVVLADTLHKYANGQATLWDVAFAALDCIPGMKGLTTLGGLAKGLKSLGTVGLKGMAKGLGKSLNSLRKGADDAIGKSKPTKVRCKGGDPIDMVSGEMLMEETDVELPGLLPLVLRRTHLSTYRWGRWFGESWASTLDERLELDNDGALFATEDGMILVYPVPGPGASVLPLEGPRWPLDWDGSPGAPIRITDPQTGHTRHFAPLAKTASADSAFTMPLAAISDRNGHRIDFDRDESGTPTAVRHSGGYHIHIDTEDDRITRLRLANPEGGPEGTTLLRYGYNTEGHLTEVYNSSGLPFKLTYDDRARITSWTDRNDSWYRFTYDDQDRCIRGEGAEGFLSCTITYDTENRETRYTNSLGHTTTCRYNELRQLAAITDPLGNTRRNEWNRRNQLLSQNDALGHTVRYEYNGAGCLTGIIRQDGSSAKAVYNDAQLPVEIHEPGGKIWRHVYDERGNRTLTVSPSGAETRFTYDKHGNLTSVSDSIGGSQQISCNAAGLPVKIIDPLGNVTSVARDAFGRISNISDPLGHTVNLNWTTEGRLVQRQIGDDPAEIWEWDGEGNLLAHTDRVGQTIRYTFTHFDKPTSRITHDGSRYSFTYDTELRLIGITNPQGLTWSYDHDASGLRISETDFNGRLTQYGRDGAGRLTSRTNGAGQRINYVLDCLGRTRKTVVDGKTTAGFVYDAAGQLVQAANPDSTVTIERDGLGRILAETVNGRTMRYTYDELGRRSSRLTPANVMSEWSYDPDGRPTSLQTNTGRLEFSYDAAGREIRRRWGDRVALSQEWDMANRLVAQTVSALDSDLESVRQETLIEHRSYSYRPDGFLTQIRELSTGVQEHVLDHHGRVTAAHAHGQVERYAYDDTGNLIHADAPERRSVGDIEYAGTLIRRDSRTRFDHDAQGRLVRKTRRLLNGQSRTWTFTWSAEDRLTGVETPDGQRWRYAYDPLGRRIAKELLDEEGNIKDQITFVWDGTRLAEQTTGHKHTTWDYVPGTHRPLAQMEQGTKAGGNEPYPESDLNELSQSEIDARYYAIVSDLVGTPTELVSSSGEVVWKQCRTVWGLPIGGSHATRPVDCPLRFPGQYHDPETGLHYNYFRYYDPEFARYVTPDPLGLEPAPNHYGYVNNPSTWADPGGLAPTECTTTIYRRQTDHPDSRRLELDENGNVTINGDGRLYLNMSGDVTPSLNFRGGDGYIVAFDVPTSYVDRVRDLALPQRMPRGMGLSPREYRHLRAERPEISDPHVSPDLYGIPPNMLDELQNGVIIEGSGRIIGGRS
ncbi:DUF6531 domain-containing protein [Streptomyces sp. 7N604]|uniref:DUF6531 domain-containing protein n=1 Tax=Streptomyces sp. 7N604 TaxID=3457415 RepID=UPI003FD1644A